MNIPQIPKSVMQRTINYILENRYCSKCAKKVWKDENKDQSFTMLPGVCYRCKKMGVVAYIERELADTKQ